MVNCPLATERGDKEIGRSAGHEKNRELAEDMRRTYDLSFLSARAMDPAAAAPAAAATPSAERVWNM